MEDEWHKPKVLNKQAREQIFNICKYFKRDSDAGMPIPDVAKSQERTPEASSTHLRTVQRIIKESRCSLGANGSLILVIRTVFGNLRESTSDTDTSDWQENTE